MNPTRAHSQNELFGYINALQPPGKDAVMHISLNLKKQHKARRDSSDFLNSLNVQQRDQISGNVVWNLIIQKYRTFPGVKKHVEMGEHGGGG